MANSHVQGALLEVDSTLLSRVDEHLQIDVDSIEHPTKDHAELEKKTRMRKRNTRSSYNRHRLETDDNVECLAASSTDFVQKERKSFGLCNNGHAVLLPAVDDVSIDKTCDPSLKQMEEKTQKFEHELEQTIGKSSVYEQKTIEVTLADRKSERNYPSCDLDANKHACLAVLNKVDNFLEVSQHSPERLPVACLRRKLLVLDLNGLLADIVTPPPKECKADTNILRRAVFKRPFCNDFLKFCFERFDIGIWSSRNKKIIDSVVDYLLGDMKCKLLFCWDISHCTKTGFRTLENKHKEVLFKELRKIWEKHDINLPWEKGVYNESNTLLLDDSPYKALLNPMHTGIFPYSYNFKDSSDNSLGAEGDLRVYLQDLATAEDLQKYVEEHPFGQRAIDETSSSWAYYHKVISNHSLAQSRT